MTSLFLQHGSASGWGVLLVDASNVFNSLNCVALLWNVHVVWPCCSTFVFNTYQGWATLVVRGSEECLYSMEGVTQGSLVYVFVHCWYPPLDLVLERELFVCSDPCRSLFDLHQWFELLLSQGPDFGHFVNPAKCCLVVHDSYKFDAEQLFSSLGVFVMCNHCYLGGFVGESVG